MKKLIFYFFLIFIIPFSVLSAPAPYYVAVNEELNQCGSFWPGDEFVNYVIPEGWEEYDEAYDLAENECSHMGYPLDENYYKNCCEKLGYEYIGKVYASREVINREIITNGEEIFSVLIIIGAVCVVLITIISLIIIIKRKNTTRNNNKNTIKNK